MGKQHLLAAMVLALTLGVRSLGPATAHASPFWHELPAAQRHAQAETLPDFVSLAAKLSPAVVNISTQSEEGQESTEPESALPGPGMSPDTRSLGSGFFINSAGYIVTNDHVIEDPGHVTVTLTSGRSYPARVVGRDRKSDVALLKIEPAEPVQSAPLGNSDRLKVGQWVMAIGNPFGFDHSVTAGIISAKDRFISGSFSDFIQTDASINPGNSGGPLIDLQGEVIGVNAAIYTRTGVNMGIGFAVPINLVKQELGGLAMLGRVRRGWLGIYIQPVSLELANSLGLSAPHGALVTEVLKGGPAERAGLIAGDVVLAFNHHPIGNSQELPLMVAGVPIGSRASLLISRGHRLRELAATIAASREGEVRRALRAEPAPPSPRLFALGLAVRDLDPALAQSLGLPEQHGVVITSVEAGGAADAAGLRARDLIVAMDHKPVASVADYQRSLAAAAGQDSVLLLVKRRTGNLFVALRRPG